MALVQFKAPPLPVPTSPEYDIQYLRQLVRVLTLYFSQLDSLTPNQANSYTADQFIGGTVTFKNVTTTQKTALTAGKGTVVFDTTLGKLCVYTGSAWETVTSV